MGVVVSRFDVFLVRLDPTKGHEMRKTRPCVVVSPDEMNRHIQTVIVAPMTTRRRQYASRVVVRFAGREGEIALDQIRVVDKRRLSRQVGRIDAATGRDALAVLAEMFAP